MLFFLSICHSLILYQLPHIWYCQSTIENYQIVDLTRQILQHYILFELRNLGYLALHYSI
jgi:hypothetical protein